jgi:hypothetical protein
VKELFSEKVQIETYVQHFNLTDPFENGDVSCKHFGVLVMCEPLIHVNYINYENW